MTAPIGISSGPRPVTACTARSLAEREDHEQRHRRRQHESDRQHR